MKLRNLIVCVTLPLLVVASGPRLFSAQAADARPSSTRQTNAPDGISSAAVPEPEVEVALSIPGDPRRVNLNEKQRIMARAIGKVAGTNHFELWLDGRLAASVFAPPAYPAPQIPGLKLPEHVETGFLWTPTNKGLHELMLTVTTASGNIFTSAPVMVEASQLQRPQLALVQQPGPSLLVTDELNIVLRAETFPEKNVTIMLTWNELPDGIVTNASVLAIHGWKLPVGSYNFEADAIDEDGLSSETLKFTCLIDPIEGAGTTAPQGLVVEPATTPGQERPRNWYPNWPKKNVRIAGAPDALQLFWNPPPAGAKTAGVLIQRLDPPSGTWKTVAIIEKSPCEWRDHGLLPERTYRYRIAFMRDNDSRTVFGPEAAESTSRPFR